MVDWEFWKQRLSVQLWEAVALSLDVDPHEHSYNDLTTSRVYSGDPGRSAAEVEEFERRFSILCDNVGRHTLLQRFSRNDGVTRNRDIPLSDFAPWAAELWPGKIPDQLKALAQRRQPRQSREELEAEIVRLNTEIDRLTTAAAAEREEFHHGPIYPKRLHIARDAWRDVSKQVPLPKSARQAIQDWIEKKHGHHLTENEIKQITFVANWDPTPGQKSLKSE